MKRNVDERLTRKREQFIARTKTIYPDIDTQLFTGKPSLAIRVNTLKSTEVYDTPISWAPDCYYSQLSREELTKLPEFENGDVYLQNPSSFIPPLVLDVKAGDKVLDMCAAPGGKAAHVAAIAANNIELWVNDNSKPRLMRMKQNFNRLNVRPHSETMLAIDKITRELPHEYYDKILLDAPCSGEGALRLDDGKSLAYWSIAQIRRLQKLQRQAIAAAWQMLKPGGTLVYSTCTMAPEENEAVIDWLLNKKENASVESIDLDIPERTVAIMSWSDKQFQKDVAACLRVKPTKTMEAFFVAKVRKNEYTDR